MARAKVVTQKVRKPRKTAGSTPAREVKPVQRDRAKAFQDAVNELSSNADQYMKEPDIGSAIRRLLNKVGVPMTDGQADSLCRAVGVDESLKPGDTDGLRSAMGHASAKLPKGAPSVHDLMKKVNPK